MNLPGLFVVGTDTGVGKTHVTSAIARSWRMAGRRVGVLKPVASGSELVGGRLVSGDTEQLFEAIGGGVPRSVITPILYEEPLAPPVAARRLGIPLHMADVLKAVDDCLAWWSERADVILVEGVGGLLCPLAEGATIADLAIALDYPLVIVGHRGLGTLNHTLLTVEAAGSRGLRIAGVILNGARPSIDPIAENSNAEELALRLGGVAILADWPHVEGLTAVSGSATRPPHPNPPPQGGRGPEKDGLSLASDSLPPCGGGLGWGGEDSATTEISGTAQRSVAPEGSDWYDLVKPSRHALEG